EARLRAHPWSRQAMRTWLLRGEGGQVLSSCETFSMASRLVRDREEDAGHTYGVASVFTEEPLRGRGHAVELLRRVHRRVASEDPAAQAFILYSEVGAGIYERAGYAARPDQDEDLVFPPSTATGPGAAELVPEAELERLLARAERPAGGFLVWPSVLQLDWHRERERIYAEALGRPRAPGCGAEHPDGVALWTGNLRSRCLYVLLMRAKTAEATGALVESARRAAGAAGLESVHVWKCPLPEGWSPASAAGQAVQRQQSLPMLCPMRPEVRAEDWTFIPRALWI
ncbi:MAG TPA: N-acetyltransferase, partial [Myxococcaceae bacterium]